MMRSAVLIAAATATLAAQTAQTPPVFRGATTLVPLDVRVADRAGRPVTNLTSADFTVLENGVPQNIRHFSTQVLTPQAPSPEFAAVRTIAEPAPLGAQTRRTFLIVLGRGRLQPPAGGVDGMIHLVRDRLLPQDLVAVIIWNRATGFTTDHAAIATLLERFKKGHERIETELEEWFWGLRAMYGSHDIPPFIQAKIDDVFAGAPGAAPRSVADIRPADAARLADDQRQIIERMQRDEELARRPADMPTIREVQGPPINLDVSLDEMAAINAQSTQDLGKIYTGIQYMRYLDGEKHLIFVSPTGVFLPRADDDHSLAAVAADARVALDIVHTGGVGPTSFDWRISTSKTAAEETGGTYSGLSYAKDFVDRLDAATRFQYVLGYYPANTALDNRFRRITVRVNRPGLTVQYRHGYFARRQFAPMDRAELLSYTRVSTAAQQSRELRDIALTVKATNVLAANNARQVHVEVKVPPDRVGFSERNGLQEGRLDVAIFCADSRGRLIGQYWNKVDMKATAEAFARFKAGGLVLNGQIAVSAPASQVKVVVYDTGSDLLGSAIVRLR